MDILITQHSVERLLQRCNGVNLNPKNPLKTIRKMIATANRVKPIDAAVQLINNGYKEAQYYEKGGVVFVVVDNTLKTVYEYRKDKFVTL